MSTKDGEGLRRTWGREAGFKCGNASGSNCSRLQSDQSDLLGSIFSDHPCADLERVLDCAKGGTVMWGKF
jgi:hypothetical protein